MRALFVLLFISLVFADGFAEKPRPHKIASGHKLARAEESIQKKEHYSLKKLHHQHEKITARIEKTKMYIARAKRTLHSRSSQLETKLASYGTRHFNHIMELVGMADEDIKDQLEPMVKELSTAVRTQESILKESVSKLVKAFNVVFDRTLIQLETAKFVGDQNDKAAKIGIKTIGHNIALGLKQAEGKNEISKKDLRKVKKISKNAEYEIYHRFHKAAKAEIDIVKKATSILKQIRHKAKSVFRELRSKSIHAYRGMFQKASKKMVKVLLGQNGLNDY